MYLLKVFKPNEEEKNNLVGKMKEIDFTEIVYFAKVFENENFKNFVICYREKNKITGRGVPTEITKLFIPPRRKTPSFRAGISGDRIKS